VGKIIIIIIIIIINALAVPESVAGTAFCGKQQFEYSHKCTII